MAQHSDALSALNEANVQLAISSIHSHQIQSNCSAAVIYSVSEQTICRQRAGKPA
jgi:hypothetical protein